MNFDGVTCEGFICEVVTCEVVPFEVVTSEVVKQGVFLYFEIYAFLQNGCHQL